MAFLVTWVCGLAAGISPDAILKRSIAGIIIFFLLGVVLGKLMHTCLGVPEQMPQHKQREPEPEVKAESTYIP